MRCNQPLSRGRGLFSLQTQLVPGGIIKRHSCIESGFAHPRGSFHINQCFLTEQEIQAIFDNRFHTGNDWLGSNKKWLENKFEKDDFDISIFSDSIFYPIRYNHLSLTVDRLTFLYPIFHSYLQIAKGEKVEFDSLITKTNNWLIKRVKGDSSKQQEKFIEVDMNKVKERAETKIKVMSGIRWQVFQRNNWRCVKCGRSAKDGVILYVDHILPRSKGGRDEISNYQTLCFECNIGKSNKIETNFLK